MVGIGLNHSKFVFLCSVICILERELGMDRGQFLISFKKKNLSSRVSNGIIFLGNYKLCYSILLILDSTGTGFFLLLLAWSLLFLMPLLCLQVPYRVVIQENITIMHGDIGINH